MADFQCIKHSKVNREYLHSNSTSHKWPFSAVAELIDNAYDPDVCAERIDIDYEELNEYQCLTFTDNGSGLDAEAMHKMLSFGFSYKKSTPTHLAVGQYGNGFKSGSMRLGKDAIVFSYKRSTKTIGFLSQTFLEDIGAESVLVPIVSWDRKGMIASEDAEPSLRAILQHSIFRTQDEIFGQFNKFSHRNKGTRIIIYNLHSDGNDRLEFDMMRDMNDIIIAEEFASAHLAITKQGSDIPEYTYSLKAFCRILYRKPRLHIYLRGKMVETLYMEKTLSHGVKDKYRPHNVKLKTDEHVNIILGFNLRMNQYGIMMYHKNRLIKPYVKVGHQSKPDERGVGVLGVVECNFLEPTHNKQDFLDTNVYRSLIKAIGQRVNTYWDENKSKTEGNAANQPDNWLQCSKSSCGKWRRLPANVNITAVKKSTWVCKKNPDPNYSDCKIPEETLDHDAAGPSNTKTKKKKHKVEIEKPDPVAAKRTCPSPIIQQPIHEPTPRTAPKQLLQSVTHSPRPPNSFPPFSSTSLKDQKSVTAKKHSSKQELEAWKEDYNNKLGEARKRAFTEEEKATQLRIKNTVLILKIAKLNKEKEEKQKEVQEETAKNLNMLKEYQQKERQFQEREKTLNARLDEVRLQKSELLLELQKSQKMLKNTEENASQKLKDAKDRKDEAVKDLATTKQKHANQLKELEADKKRRSVWLDEYKQQVKDKEQNLNKQLAASQRELSDVKSHSESVVQEKNAELQAARQQLHQARGDHANDQELLRNLREKVFHALQIMFRHINGDQQRLSTMVTDSRSSQVDHVIQEIINDNT